ncbi:unnamed protein product [Rhizoctonia solani]|uniref:SP-RING-type domain-containing protein n=1 Tax=Rhizoctonia solani TaxID=456999 RepID=A0A8H3DVK3_9AGAM|nr:unnamed protein product [Rhizoctonia solani]
MDVFEWLELNHAMHSARENGSESQTKTDTDADAGSDIEAHVEVGSEIVSLRCPISCLRISTPVRFSGCTHAQCFDQDSWTSLIESSSRRACPVCDQRIIASETLEIDRFMESVLEQVPDIVDHILVERDGEWHTKDGIYGSSGSPAKRTEFSPGGQAIRRKASTSAQNAPTGRSRGGREQPIVVESNSSDNSDKEGFVSNRNTLSNPSGGSRVKVEEPEIYIKR